MGIWDEPKFSYEESWESLKNVLREIQRGNNSGVSFAELYTIVYRMVINRKINELYARLDELIITHHKGEVCQNIIDSINSADFLRALATAWVDHQGYIKIFRDVLSYSEQERIQKHYNLVSVNILGCHSFISNVIENELIIDRLRQAMLDSATRERCGEEVDQIVIKDTFKMLMKIYINNRDVYETTFEPPFLKLAADFYRLEAKKLLDVADDVSDYIEKVEKIMRDESEIDYLDTISKRKLMDIIKNEYISKQMKYIVENGSSGLVHMFEHNRKSEMVNMYRLLSRVPNGAQFMALCLGKHLQETGVCRLMEDNDLKNENTKYAINYIQNILDSKCKLDRILDSILVVSKLVIQNFLNRNKNAPEYLSLYIDYTFKKGFKELNGGDVELFLDEAVELFKSLKEKDVFQSHYEKHLAKRLLHNKSASADLENSMMIRLTNECGTQFTSKLNGMVKDKIVSKTLNSAYQRYIDDKSDAEDMAFNILVLTTVNWPIQTYSTCELPYCALNALTMFADFYSLRHRGRRLMLNPGFGNADLFAVFLPVQQEKGLQKSALPCNVATSAVAEKNALNYILNVSTFQMCVLMLFNDTEKISYKDIKTLTGIGDKELTSGLQSLAMGKPKQRVLNKIPKTENIASDDVFVVNENFESKFRRVEIKRIAVPREENAESAQVKTKVVGDRRYAIEAAIIRVMKAKKTILHSDLISEVTSQLKSYFSPSVPNIKEQIEKLIEREFLSRDKENVKKYIYIA